ncbi:MAG: N-6 DNA methylase [Candidatus Kapabacteria bacterium]|nr:N-6 DNA methylase [Candidatus Kapabacteria bacterium]
MITINNLSKVLETLGFTKSKEIYTKHFEKFDCDLKVDFEKKELIYPESTDSERANGIVVNDHTTCNFDHPENFVVFECVCRLMDKGYRPEHIELEKRWNLGHDRKGGKADICVYDADRSQMLLIIECKTAGTEYKKALKLLNEDGGQLFSYWQQERATKWISLYASDFDVEKITYENDIINCTDDKNIELLAEKDESALLYKNAHTVTELFDAWDETYGKQLLRNLIFGDDCVAYTIGVKPLRKKDLRDFTPDDKIVNQFEEILRHNNVSDKENAFNRLIALFICKLVDEINKSDNDEVEFQYKQGTDTYESLQDRLQKLHRDGMERFMKEKIVYVADDYADNLFKQKLNGEKRKSAIADLKQTIRILKFYSNNDFSFKDVHNEELFYQNGKILVEVVQLFEKYRIVYPSKHQFLGDLFEQLLNKGFKQNEGQFFTPMPITRFIWDCLPMSIIMQRTNGDMPKIVDYACGAGHFLTEAVEAVNDWLRHNGKEALATENKWVEKSIFGIEKDYRLARVAKVSLYMNGAGEGKIVFGDGLEQYLDKEIENGSFDILVANPPYSVSAFKAHLKIKNNTLELLDKISNNGSEIETLFVERIAQLLKPQGVAAVILPSSILSNDSGSYTAAREMILQNFLLRAIAQFGSKTFGATGTNTVVLFLEKYNEPPKHSDMACDSVNAILNNENLEGWDDAEIYKSWLQKIKVSDEDYRAFVTEAKELDEWANVEYFAQYVDEFNKSTEIINYKKGNVYKKLKAQQQTDELRKRFYAKTKEAEREKLHYFALVYEQTTLIITAPADNAAQKTFLGYDWSNRKGAEGIVITTPGGKLYNPDDRNADGNLAAAVRTAFANKIAECENYAVVARLQDMIDFSRTSFNKAIKLTPDKTVEIKSKYPLVKLGDYVETLGGLWTGKKPPFENVAVIRNTNFTMKGDLNLSDVAMIDVEKNAFEKRKLQKGDIIIEKSGGSETQAVGRVVLFNLDNGNYAYSNFTARIRIINKELMPTYLHIILNDYYQQGFTFDYQSGASGLKNLDLNRYLTIQIPLPPLEIQQQIVAECEKVDKEYNSSRMSIEDYKKKIAQVFENLEVITKTGGVNH